MVTAKLIAMGEAKNAAAEFTTLDEQLDAAMRVTKNHWMCVDPDDRFMAALEAVYALVGEEDKVRIVAEIKGLHSVTLAAIGGYGITNLEDLALENPIGLLPKWNAI